MQPIVKRVVPARVRARLRRGQSKIQLLRVPGIIPRRAGPVLRYVFLSREIDNFTYDIANRPELARTVAAAFGVGEPVVQRFIDELDRDEKLRSELGNLLRGRSDRPISMPFGRRIGWYAAARVAKPKILVETGVHDGLGSALLLRALERNSDDGVEGRLLSFDIRDDVGWLIPASLRSRHEIHVGDSLSLIPQVLAGRSANFFVHDSDHAYEHETAELDLIFPLSAPGAALLSDNVHECSAFVDFCTRNGLEAHVFMENPVRHFFAGAGLGITQTSNMAP